MKLIINILLVAGFCIGTVGAAGFHSPLDPKSEDPDAPTEPMAWPLFGSGIALVFIGGFLSKSHAKEQLTAQEQGGGGLKEKSRALLDSIRDRVADLDQKKASLSSEEVREIIDHLLAGEYFDLTSQNEELAALLGFKDYARVWEGVATAERLLARTWSLATDGYLEEGLVEIPRARQHLEHSAAVMATL